MTNPYVIVIHHIPQECGERTLTFVDCSTGEILKKVYIGALTNGYWDAVFRNKTVGTPIKVYLGGGRDTKKLKNLEFKAPWLCVLKKNSYMLELIQTFHEYTLDWSGINAGSISETEDVSPKTWIKPEETQFYEMLSCKYLYTKHHSGVVKSKISNQSTSYSYDTFIYEIQLAPVTFSEEPVYHKDSDSLFKELAEQGIDPSNINDEDRITLSHEWLTDYIANQLGYCVLNIINCQ